MDAVAARMPAHRLQLFSIDVALRRGECRGGELAGARHQSFPPGRNLGPDVRIVLCRDHAAVSVRRHPGARGREAVRRACASGPAAVPHRHACRRQARCRVVRVAVVRHSGAFGGRGLVDGRRTLVCGRDFDAVLGAPALRSHHRRGGPLRRVDHREQRHRRDRDARIYRRVLGARFRHRGPTWLARMARQFVANPGHSHIRARTSLHRPHCGRGRRHLRLCGSGSDLAAAWRRDPGEADALCPLRWRRGGRAPSCVAVQDIDRRH